MRDDYPNYTEPQQFKQDKVKKKPNPMRCKSTKEYRGIILQCKGAEGHEACHYNLNIWWPKN